MISTAMVLAAGRGERMRPLSDATPKPLLEIGGRTMLDRAIDWLVDSGVTNVVVNAHHHADALIARLNARTRPALRISRESDLMGSGGGVVKALGLLGDGPFLVLNADLLWADPGGALADLAAAWQPRTMDFLLMLAPIENVQGEGGRDYHLDPGHRLRRDRDKATAPYMFAGIYVTSAASFGGAPAGVFSMLELWDACEARGRLFGHVFDGTVWHVGTPSAYAAANRAFAPRP